MLVIIIISLCASRILGFGREEKSGLYNVVNIVNCSDLGR